MGANGCALTPGDGHALECGEACARVDVGAMVLPLQLAHQAVLHSADASGRQTAQLGARRSYSLWSKARCCSTTSLSPRKAGLILYFTVPLIQNTGRTGHF